MRLQDHMIDVTKAAADELFRYFNVVPEDKVQWKPLDTGRSVFEIAQEIALCPRWCKDVITMEGMPEWSEESQAKVKAEQDALTTVAECEAECNRRLEELFEFFRAMPDEDLAKTKWLPYNGGREHTMPEMMDYPRWNFNYHLGQVAYIQKLYGDHEMH